MRVHDVHKHGVHIHILTSKLLLFPIDMLQSLHDVFFDGSNVFIHLQNALSCILGFGYI